MVYKNLSLHKNDTDNSQMVLLYGNDVKSDVRMHVPVLSMAESFLTLGSLDT